MDVDTGTRGTTVGGVVELIPTIFAAARAPRPVAFLTAPVAPRAALPIAPSTPEEVLPIDPKKLIYSNIT